MKLPVEEYVLYDVQYMQRLSNDTFELRLPVAPVATGRNPGVMASPWLRVRVVPGGDAVGYRLSNTDASSTTVDPTAELVDGGFAPKAGFIVVLVNLPLQPLLTRTVVRKRQDFTQVVTSGVGFLSLM
jgi:hypothetical protein